MAMLVDETGSMGNVKSDTLEAINKFNQELDKNTIYTLCFFNSLEFRTKFDGVKRSDINVLQSNDYNPNATTNLLDSVMRLIKNVEIATLKMKSKPNVLIVIVTDGLENASVEFKGTEGRRKIFDAISEKQKEGWTFVYLGANQDSWTEGGSLGISSSTIRNYQASNPKQAFSTVSVAYRSHQKGARGTELFSDSGTTSETKTT